MNGNVTDEFDWLAPRGSHSGTADVYRETEAAIGPFAHPFAEGGPRFSLSVFFVFAPVREPSGDRLVTQRSWVSPPESMAAGSSPENGGETEACQRW